MGLSAVSPGKSAIRCRWASGSCHRENGFDAYQKLRRELTGIAKPIDGYGEAQFLAGWLEGQVGRHLGDDFRWGGRLAFGTPARLSYRATGWRQMPSSCAAMKITVARATSH